MAFNDLCHIDNSFKTVENEPDQSDRELVMEENPMVQDLITKILDDSGPTEGSSSIPPPDKSINSIPSINQYPKNETTNTFMPSPPYNYNNNLYNFNQSDNGYNFNMSNGFNTNGFVNYLENDVNSLVGLDAVSDDSVTPEQLNLLRLAAQEIGGAQFSNPNKYDDKFYNFFEPNQRNSIPETNMFSGSYNRPNSLNIDMNFNSNYDYNAPRYQNKYENGFMKDHSQDSTDLFAYLNQLNSSNDRTRDDFLVSDFKVAMDLNTHYQNDDYNKIQEERNKLIYNNNRNYQVPNKCFNGDNFFANDQIQMSDRSLGQNYDYPNQSNLANYKMNGYQQNDFVQRRDVNPVLPRDGFQNGNNVERNNFEVLGRDNGQQALMRQQELSRQMALLMRNRPLNPLNVDVSFFHENTPYNLGLGALIGPSPTQVPPPVLASPMLDVPLLAPFYAMRNMRGAATSSSILHARLDACYEQWRQLERERKRTEARLALAYPGRAVSSSNSIPVPRLPPCPTRVDRLTVDMLREHTKVLTLMGKMETLRASVCLAQNKRPNKEDSKITVLKRGQDNVAEKDVDPATFDPSGWREDVKNLSEIAPHSEVESAMLAWRSAVVSVQAARRRELAPHVTVPHARYVRPDPILQLAEAVKTLCESARRARCAMWCDLTLTVALAPHTAPNQNSPPFPKQMTSPKQSPQENTSTGTSKSQEQKEDKPAADSNQQSKPDTKPDEKPNKHPDKEKNNHRRTQNYRKVNQRNDFYQKNSRYDNRIVHNRNPYHYLATGPIN